MDKKTLTFDNQHYLEVLKVELFFKSSLTDEKLVIFL